MKNKNLSDEEKKALFKLKKIAKKIKYYNKFYHEKVGDGLLFKTARGLPMSSNTLTKYLINWSNEFLPPVVLEDGSKRLRNCSVNMIVKIFQSDKYGEIKRKQLEESKNRGNDTTTMNKHYVSTKKPTGFY